MTLIRRSYPLHIARYHILHFETQLVTCAGSLRVSDDLSVVVVDNILLPLDVDEDELDFNNDAVDDDKAM